MALSRAAYRNFSATQLNNRFSATCSHSVNGSNVDCTAVDTTKINSVLGVANRSWSTMFADTDVNHWSAWGPTKRTVSGGVLVNSHYANNYDIGCMAGYNHSAVTPHYDSGGSTLYNYIASGQSQTFSCVIDIGELLYNDVASKNTITHVFFSVWDGSTCVGNSGIALSSAADGTGDSNSILDFSQAGTRITVTNITSTTTYTCKIWFCSSGTWDYAGAYLEYKLSELADWTHYVRVASGLHYYVNAPYNDGNATGTGTFTSNQWTITTPSLNTSDGKFQVQAIQVTDYGTYTHAHMNVYMERGYYNGSTWTVDETFSASSLFFDGYFADGSGTGPHSNITAYPAGAVPDSGYGFRVVINISPS